MSKNALETAKSNFDYRQYTKSLQSIFGADMIYRYMTMP